MEQWKKNTYVLWFTVFMSAICWTMVMPFTPTFLEELGVTHAVEFWSGIIISASAVCNMVTAPIWGAVGDRFGRKMMMLRAGVCLALGYAGMAIVVGPVSLLLVRMAIGGLTGFVPMSIALVGVSTPQKHVGEAMALVQTAWPSGALIGPVVGGIAADSIGIRGSSWLAFVIIALMTALVMATVKEEFAPATAVRAGILSDLKVAASHRVLVSIVLITTVLQASIMALEPVLVPFVHDLAGQGAPGWVAGLLFSIPGVAFILMARWWTRKGESIGYARTVSIGLAGSAVLYLAQGFAPGEWSFGALRLLSGVFGAAIGPGVAALLATAVPRELRGRAFGLNQSASSLGAIVGPLLGGYIASFVNARGVFVLTAVILTSGFFWVRSSVEPRLLSASMAD